MIKKIPIRLRLTMVVIILLASCCVGLTLILNKSAFRMVDIIEATKLTPAKTTDPAAKVNDPLPHIMIPNIASQAIKTNYKAKSIIYMVFIVILGGVFTYYLLGKVLFPLKSLSLQMKKVNIDNLSEDIALPEVRDEIYDLTHSFNEMTHKLNDAFTMQRRFSQNAAHELRTPLTVLKTKVDVFKKRKDHSIEEYDELINVISSNTDRLSNLVKSLLTHSNMENLNLNESIFLRGILIEAVEELSSIAKRKNLTINIVGAEKVISGNKDLLYRAFYNLIENSIKYNVNNGGVDIIISENNGKAVVQISDTGIGIPDDVKENIFEPLFRVDKSRSRDMGGSGLGLSIVKSIINKHKGEILVLNNKPKGTIFKVIL